MSHQLKLEVHGLLVINLFKNLSWFKPNEALRLCLLTGLCITSAQVRVGGKDLRLDVTLVEEAVLAIEEDVCDDVPLVLVEIRFGWRKPTVNKGSPHLERLSVLKEKMFVKFKSESDRQWFSTLMGRDS